MARRSLPRKITYFEPVPPRLARNTIIESTFDATPATPGVAFREGHVEGTGDGLL